MMKSTIGNFFNHILIMALTLLFTQCGKDKISPGKEYAGYITAFTTGEISRNSAIRIEFHEEIKSAVPDGQADPKLFAFSPSVPGKAVWIDKRTLEFRPEASLPPDKIFRVKFRLSKILNVPSSLKVFDFSFRTGKMSLKTEVYGFKPYDINDLKWQKFTGRVVTSDFADDKEIEKAFSAKQSGKLSISWEHSEGTVHSFTIDSIQRKDERGVLEIEYDGRHAGSDDKGSIKVDIPALGDFEITNVIVTQQPQQSITVYFSDPPDPDQDLEGLIYLASGARSELLVVDNEVRVYPVTPQTVTSELIVESPVRNINGHTLKDRFVTKAEFLSLKPAVEFIGDGVILPASEGLILPFRAVSLNAVTVRIIKIMEDNIARFMQVNQFDGMYEMKRVGRLIYKNEISLLKDGTLDYNRWNTFTLDLASMITPDPGAIYRVQISFDKSNSIYPCSDTDNENGEPALNPGFETEALSFDDPEDYYYYDDDYYYYDNYNWEEREDPCKVSYYRNRSVSRNVFASDLGIIAKSADGKNVLVAVTDLRTTEQLSGVDIELYNFQNQLTGSGKTSGDGTVLIDSDGKPFLLVARKGDQRGYLRLDDGTSLSLSMFEAGGQITQSGLKGFIYGERGVWRPGDSIYLSFILEDRNKTLPEDFPVIFELITPDNKVFYKKTSFSSLNGFYDFRTSTSADAVTGNWLAKVSVGGASFTKTVKIETIKPNRLKINLDFHTEILKKSSPVEGDLDVKWLHGAVAGNIRTEVIVNLRHTTTVFDGYSDYTFDDPVKQFEPEEQVLYDGRLDVNGRVKINPVFKISGNSPGLIDATFRVRAFETGGDFSTDIFTLPYSSYSSYVGFRIPEGPGWNGAVYSDEPTLIPVVTLSETGSPVSRTKVKVQIYSLTWRWWWEHYQEDDLARFITGNSNNLIKTDYIDTPPGGRAVYEMNLNTRSYGRKLIIFTDPVSGHTSGKVFYTTYNGWYPSPGDENPEAAEVLTFSTDKSDYLTGETVTVSLPENQQGKALVSLESGSRIVSHFWVEPKGTNNAFTFKTTDEMAPNVYIHISYIQPHNNTVNDMPIRLYGVQNINVTNPATTLEPVLSLPDVLRPEEDVTIRVKEAKGRRMTYTIAVVDEGLLDLTRFRTPDPWSSFYAREALGIKTWDMYRYVAGALAGEYSGLLATGGDEDIINAGDQKANRFVPVVKFLGPFEYKGSGTDIHTFTMPNYVGSVRTMLIAGNNGAYGYAETTTPVKKPLMVLATLPRVAGPGESIKLPVTVFAMEPSVKDVTVSLSVKGPLTITGPRSRQITFSSEGEQMVYFDLKAPETTGVAAIEISATGGGESASYNTELDVRSANPPSSTFITAIVEPGSKWSSVYNPAGIENTRSGNVEFSVTPLPAIESRLKYLMTYPHGCIEQVTSSVFPQLYIGSVGNLTSAQKSEAENNVKAAINKIRSFQMTGGGMTYWPGRFDRADDWGTTYAGHFLLEAKSKGFNVPEDMIANWISFQQKAANNWALDPRASDPWFIAGSQLMQAYRLYTLALAGKPALGAMNRMREGSSLSTAARWRLAAAYHISGRQDIAEQIINSISMSVEPYKEMASTYGSEIRDLAMILETLTLMKRTSDAQKVALDLASRLGADDWYSTQTTSWSLLAVSKFLSLTGTGEIDLSMSLDNGNAVNVKTPAAVSVHEIPVDKSGHSITVTNNSRSTLFIKIQLDGVPPAGKEVAGESGLNMTVRYIDLDGNPVNPATIEQGRDFMAEVIVRHPGLRAEYNQLALTQVFPSGWEISNIRMDNTTVSYMKDLPDYQDIRDDRIYSYFSLRPGQVKVFRVLLNAAYEGRYYLPSVKCEAMYDNEVHSNTTGTWTEVISP